MLNLFDNAIKHLPKIKIPKENIMYLGYVDNYDVILAVEEGEFRIYSYEYWSWDSIVGGEHENEDWWANIETYFGEGDGYLDKDTCEYVVPHFQNDSVLDMATELYVACTDRLEDIGYRIDSEGVPSTELVEFFRRGREYILKHNGTLVYGYYK